MSNNGTFKLEAEIDLQDVDGISCVKINPWNSQVLAISTWNGYIDIINIYAKKRIERHEIKCPQLSLEWTSQNNFASGGADGIVYINGVKIGYHNAAISSLAFSSKCMTLASGSYDGVIKLWSMRNREVIKEFTTNDKILCMTPLYLDSIVCGCLENRVYGINCQTKEISKINNTLMHGYNTRQIAACEDLIAVSVVQGRIAIIDNNTSDRSKSFAFKAHLSEPKDLGESKTVYPVNAMQFQPKTNFLVTGGTDGAIYAWDIKQRRRVQTLFDQNGEFFSTSISSLSFSSDGLTLAAAISYCFENGPIQHPPDRLVIYTYEK